MLVINSIEKTRLSADSYSYSGTGVAWKARLVLFLGFALMAGGLAGSVVSFITIRLRVHVKIAGTDFSFTGSLGTQIRRVRAGLSLFNALLWHRQCRCKRPNNVEVCDAAYL